MPLVFVVFLILPILHNSPYSAFFTIDPDAVYLSNIVLFAKTGTINYIDHPGTPAIMIQGALFLPIAFYTKFLLHQSFLNYFLSNVSFFAITSRIISSLFVSAGIAILLFSIYKFTKVIYPVAFVFVALLSFEPLYYAGVSISAVYFNVFIASVWVLFFTIFLNKRDLLSYFFLLLVSGIAVANRLTALLLPFGTLMLITTMDLSWYKKIKLSAVSIILLIISFAFGISPILSKSDRLVNWFILLAGSKDIHGGGSEIFISIEQYYASISNLLTSEAYRGLIVVCLGGIVVCVLLKFFNKFIERELILILFFAILFILAFSKYPLAHYQQTNFIIVASVVSLLFSKVKSHIVLFFIILLIPQIYTAANRYESTVISMIMNTKNFETYAANNRDGNPEIWDWSRSKEFALIWIRDYGSIYTQDFRKSYPYIYSVGENVDWDKAYIQKDSLLYLKQKYVLEEHESSKIPGVDTHYLITKP